MYKIRDLMDHFVLGARVRTYKQVGRVVYDMLPLSDSNHSAVEYNMGDKKLRQLSKMYTQKSYFK